MLLCDHSLGRCEVQMNWKIKLGVAVWRSWMGSASGVSCQWQLARKLWSREAEMRDQRDP